MQITSNGDPSINRPLYTDNAKEQFKTIDSLEKAVVHYITSSSESHHNISIKEIQRMFMYARKSIAYGESMNGTRSTND